MTYLDPDSGIKFSSYDEYVAVRAGRFSASSEDRNDLAWWFPKIEAAGLPVPQTEIVRSEGEDLGALLDYRKPNGFDDLVARIDAAADRLAPGRPFFLRTGHISGKHQWRDACYVPHPHTPDVIGQHVFALVEESHMDIFGDLTTETWVIREMLDTAPLFRCELYGGFPVVREFRFFVRDGAVEHMQPYWPEEAAQQGGPDDPEWRSKLREVSQPGDDIEQLAQLAVWAGQAVGGYWSVDLLQDAAGKWWLTDMAEGERSFRYDP